MRLLTCLVVFWALLGRIRSDSVTGKYVHQGCFKEPPLYRQMEKKITPFSAGECFTYCYEKGYAIVGLSSTFSMCFCFNDMKYMRKIEDVLCMPCKNDTDYYCGDIHKISLYKTELPVTTDNLTNGPTEIESMFEDGPLILLSGQGGIHLYNTSNHILKSVIKVDSPIEALDYHLPSKTGFAIWNETLFRFPLFGDKQLLEHEAHHVDHIGRCPTFAVDWEHDKIYFPNCYYHYISFINVYNDTEVTWDVIIHLSDEGAWALDMQIDPYKGLLFWTSGATLWSCRLDGKGLTKVVPAFPVNRVSSLFVDFASERVYFSGPDKQDKISSKVHYATYGGVVSSSLQFLEVDGGTQIPSFGILNHSIYFVENTGKNTSEVFLSKLDFTQRPIVVFGIGEFQAKRLRMVHPQLQSPSETDACTDYECSHLCLIEGSLPRCYCPIYHELDDDQKTCILAPGVEDETPMFMSVCFGVFRVILVLLGAGGLMFLGDKLWSHLHPAVVTLSVPGSARSTFTGRLRQDGENLI